MLRIDNQSFGLHNELSVPFECAKHRKKPDFIKTIQHYIQHVVCQYKNTPICVRIKKKAQPVKKRNKSPAKYILKIREIETGLSRGLNPNNNKGDIKSEKHYIYYIGNLNFGRIPDF